MIPLSKAPPNAVLTPMDMKVACILCEKLGMRQPMFAIEDTNLVTLDIQGYAFCLSRRDKRKVYKHRSLRRNFRTQALVRGYLLNIYHDGDEIFSEWQASFEQVLGTMFRTVVEHMADDIGRTEQMALDAKERDPDAESDPLVSVQRATHARKRVAMTANVISQVMHSAVIGAPDPKVGDGLSICMWSDRYAGTVVEVINPNLVAFTEDDVKADKTKPCPMGHQNWIMTPQPNGPRRHAMKHSNGRWYIARLGKHGRYTVSKKSTPVAMGEKSYYHDWSF